MLPPNNKSTLDTHSASEEDGLYEISSLNGKDPLILYKEDKYWNPDLKFPFIKSVSSLWGKDVIEKSKA